MTQHNAHVLAWYAIVDQAYELGTLDQGILDEFLPGVKL